MYTLNFLYDQAAKFLYDQAVTVSGAHYVVHAWHQIEGHDKYNITVSSILTRDERVK